MASGWRGHLWGGNEIEGEKKEVAGGGGRTRPDATWYAVRLGLDLKLDCAGKVAGLLLKKPVMDERSEGEGKGVRPSSCACLLVFSVVIGTCSCRVATLYCRL